MITISQMAIDHAPLPADDFTFRAGNGKFTLVDHSEGVSITLTEDELADHIAIELCDYGSLPTPDDIFCARNILAHSGKNAISHFMFSLMP